MKCVGGIDVGGTKIEAKLFANDWQVRKSRRIDAPNVSYEKLLDAIEEQYRWLVGVSGQPSLPIGLGLPGIEDQFTGKMTIANLPVKGRNLRSDLNERIRRPLNIISDCHAFVLSEAKLGAGKNYSSVLGMILGTGVSGGLAIDGQLNRGKNGVAGEFGHTPLPATLVQKYELPVLNCGCGNLGCFETLISGPGMSRLAKALFDISLTPSEISDGAKQGDETLQLILDIWTELTCALIRNLVLVVDPDCVILGGGLSKLPDVAQRLADGLSGGIIEGVGLPDIRLAQGGDSSGARGAALAVVEIIAGDDA